MIKLKALWAHYSMLPLTTCIFSTKCLHFGFCLSPIFLNFWFWNAWFTMKIYRDHRFIEVTMEFYVSNDLSASKKIKCGERLGLPVSHTLPLPRKFVILHFWAVAWLENVMCLLHYEERGSASRNAPLSLPSQTHVSILGTAFVSDRYGSFGENSGPISPRPSSWKGLEITIGDRKYGRAGTMLNHTC